MVLQFSSQTLFFSGSGDHKFENKNISRTGKIIVFSSFILGSASDKGLCMR